MNSRKVLWVRLKDGTEVSLRPIGADDKPLLEEGMTRLSAQSRRLRFMAPIDSLSRAQLSYLTEIDHRNHLAWGVLCEDEPVAVGRVVRLADAGAAELAITVVDAFQRRGIGRLLVELLADLSRSLGIQRFVFEALPENDAVIRLLHSYGADYRQEGGVVTGSLDLSVVPAAPVPVSAARDLAHQAQDG